MAPRTPRAPRRDVEVAMVEAVKGIVKEATAGSTQVIALGTQQSKEASDSAMRRESDLSARLKDIQDRFDLQHRELCSERGKNAEHTVRLRQLDNDLTVARLNRDSQREAIGVVKEFGDKVLHNLAMKHLAEAQQSNTNGAAQLSDRPSTETLIEALIRDLRPSTVAILYMRARHLLLPILAGKDFLMSAYGVTIGTMDEELMGALAIDLGPEASKRIMAIARSAGYGQ